MVNKKGRLISWFIFILIIPFLLGCQSAVEISWFGIPEEQASRNVIVNLDDIGVHKDVTDASIELMRKGMARSASVMVPPAGFEYAVRTIEANPDLDFGIHVTLTNEWQEKLPWAPLLPKEKVPSLYNEKGLMWETVDLLLKNSDPIEVEMEMEEQIKKALASGIRLTHMDAHMGSFYSSEELLNIALKLSKKYDLFIPIPRYKNSKNLVAKLKEEGYRVPDSYMGFYEIDGEDADHSLSMDTYKKYLGKLKPGNHFIYIHAVYPTNEIMDIMHDYKIRTRDFRIWSSEEMLQYAKSKNINFTSFGELGDFEEK